MKKTHVYVLDEYGFVTGEKRNTFAAHWLVTPLGGRVLATSNKKYREKKSSNNKGPFVFFRVHYRRYFLGDIGPIIADNLSPIFWRNRQEIIADNVTVIADIEYRQELHHSCR